MWTLGPLALVAVIAVTVSVTVLVTRGAQGGSHGDPSPPLASDIASANDEGPIAIITDDPSCANWIKIATQLADRNKNGWEKRDPSIPASNWSPEQRRQYEEVGTAMRDTAKETVALVSQTPHRVIREYLEQFIAYARAYADSIPTYTSEDESLARVAINSASVMTALCTAISYGSAGSSAAAVAAVDPPSATGPVNDPNKPEKYLKVEDRACREMPGITASFDAQTAEWRSLDPAIVASDQTPEQAAVRAAAALTFNSFASRFEALAKDSDSPVLADFALMITQYFRAYVQALPTYTTTDSYLAKVGISTIAILKFACLGAT